MRTTSATTRGLRTWSTPSSTSTVRSTLLPPGRRGRSMGSRPDSLRMPDPSPTSEFSSSYLFLRPSPHLTSPRCSQGWPLGSCLHYRKLATWATRLYYVQPDNGWPINLLNVGIPASSRKYSQTSITISRHQNGVLCKRSLRTKGESECNQKGHLRLEIIPPVVIQVAVHGVFAYRDRASSKRFGDQTDDFRWI